MWAGVVVLIIGILYLGQDLGWWGFWTLKWWTVMFLLIGIKVLAHTRKK